MSGLEELLTSAVDRGDLPGAIGLLGGAAPEVVAVGRSRVDGPPMPEDAIVRLQSMTKAITAVAALRLVEAGRIALDDSIEPWVPELADRQVLARPDAPLDQTVAAVRPITVRHLLTNMSGYGMATSPALAEAMMANGTEASAAPVDVGPDTWLARLAELPLVGQPGEVWRYHHSFGILGALLSRVVGRPLPDHLRDDLFDPLGLDDTGFWVPSDRADRLPAAYRHAEAGLVEVEPAAGGFYVGPPPYDVSHAELVGTARDFHRFLRALLAGSLVSGEHRAMMTTDQVPPNAKTDDSFFPGFWNGAGWGFGVCVQPSGRWGWSGGLGTDFWVDPDETIGILLTQVEMGERVLGVVDAFGRLRSS